MPDIFEVSKSLESYRNGTTTTASLVITVLTLIAMWRIFEKAGEGGWKVLIPIYNLYIMCKILKMHFWLMIIAIICLIIPFVNIIAAIYLIYVAFAFDFRLSRAFGHGFLFGLGLVFFNTIFILILGFNSDKYTPSKI